MPIVDLPPEWQGRWRITRQAVEARQAAIAEALRLTAEHLAGRQLSFDFDAPPDCDICDGEGELDCPKCDGRGCSSCDGGRIDCPCSGGPERIEEDSDGPSL